MSRQQKLIAAACELACLPDDAPRAIRPFRHAHKQLHQTLEVGKRLGSSIAFDGRDRQIIARWLEAQGIDPKVGVPENLTGRTELAAYQVDEKDGASAVAQHHGLMAIASAGSEAPTLNDHPLPVGLAGYMGLKADTALTVGADWLLTVENLDTFLSLCEDATPLARDGRGLLVFRGDPARPAGMRWAQEVARDQRMPLWHAPDVDPKGLSDCLNTRFAGAWLPAFEGLVDGLIASRGLFDKQIAVVPRLKPRATKYFPELLPWVEWICREEVGLTQERAFAVGIKFNWVANSAYQQKTVNQIEDFAP